MDTIRLKARAKINLGLDVVRRREDGYHEVKMVMQMLRLYDQIDIEKTQESGILVRSNLSFLPTDERNIAYKAAKVMIDQFGLEQGVIIRIEKHIPVAAESEEVKRAWCETRSRCPVLSDETDCIVRGHRRDPYTDITASGLSDPDCKTISQCFYQTCL